MMAIGHLRIAIFLLTTIFLSSGDADRTEYISLISDIRSQYKASCIIFMYSRHADQQEMTTAHSLTRNFSARGVFTLISHLDVSNNRLTYYKNRVGRPLVVIFIRRFSEIEEFRETEPDMKKSYIVWLVIFHGRGNDSICSYCNCPSDNRFGVRFDTTMLVVCCEKPTLQEWWSVNQNDTEVGDLGNWTRKDGLTWSTNYTLTSKRHEIQGTNLSVIYVLGTPFFRRNGDKYTGFFGDILNELRSAMNFTVQSITPVMGFGTRNSSTNVWSGAIGVLQKRKADIALGITMTVSRIGVVDFTYPIIQTRTKLIIKKPTGIGINWFAHFEVFKWEIWMILIVLLITSPVLLAIIKALQGSQSFGCSYFENYLSVWGIFCQQALFQFPAELPMRMAYYAIFASGIVVYAAYSASLISFITVSVETSPFTDLESFVADGSYKLIVDRDSLYYEFFNESNIPIVKKMKAMLKPWSELPRTSDEAWDQVCNQRVALVTSEAERRISFHPCKLLDINTGGLGSLGIAFPSGSQYTSAINYHLQRFKISGLFRRLQDIYYSKNDAVQTTYDVVEFSGIVPILIILGSGVMLAFLIWLFETLYHAYENRKRRRLIRVRSRINNGIGRRIRVRGRDHVRAEAARLSHLLRNAKIDPSFIGYHP